MTSLVLAAIAFVGLHLLPSTALRPALVGRLGDTGYLGLFSLLSIATFLWMLFAYLDLSPAAALWQAGTAWRWVMALLMLPAFVLVVMGAAGANPAMVRAGTLLDRSTEPTGIFAVTRHPVMTGIALWAGLHLAARPELPALLFFGGLFVTAVLGARLQEARKRAELGEKWAAWGRHTSGLPFLALVEGRARLVFSGGDWGRLGAAVLAWAAMLHFHTALIGLPVGLF